MSAYLVADFVGMAVADLLTGDNLAHSASSLSCNHKAGLLCPCLTVSFPTIMAPTKTACSVSGYSSVWISCCWSVAGAVYTKFDPQRLKNLDITTLVRRFPILLFFLLLLLLVKTKLYIKEKNNSKIGFSLATAATVPKTL